jgi:ketosteroid isomerase-like protein
VAGRGRGLEFIGIRDKAGEIKDAATPDPDFVCTQPFTTEDLRVKIYKDAAVVMGLAKWGVQIEGSGGQSGRYTHSYAKQQDPWRIVAQQVSSNLYKPQTSS